MRAAVFFLVLLGLGGLGSASAQLDGGSKAEQTQMHQRKAQEFLSQKNPQLAAKEFAAILAIDPHNLDAQANLGVLLYFQKDYAGAEPHLRSAIEQQPDLVKIRVLLGMCEKHLGKIDLASADLEAVVSQVKEPNVQLEAGLELIEIYTAENDLEKAAGVVAILRAGAPTDPRILYAAYRIYSDLAGEAMLDLSIAAPESGQMHQAMAHELYRERDLPGTIANFRKAAEADPNLPGIHFELAEALHSSPDPKVRAEAEQEYRLALSSNSRDEKAINRLGDLAFDKNDLDGATSYYKQALALAPNDADATIGLAHVYTEKGKPQSAEPLLLAVIAADPTNVLAHYRLSSVYRAMNRPADAKHEIEMYRKYKDIKEKLRIIYKEMRSNDPRDEAEK
jgi:tetratricopeptide (TPR) repeat protein